VKLKLLSRRECHLCELVARELTRLNITFDTIDVDMDEALVSRYGDVVPVLLNGDKEIVRQPFTLPALRKALSSRRPAQL